MEDGQAVADGREEVVEGVRERREEDKAEGPGNEEVAGREEHVGEGGGTKVRREVDGC